MFYYNSLLFSSSWYKKFVSSNKRNAEIIIKNIPFLVPHNMSLKNHQQEIKTWVSTMVGCAPYSTPPFMSPASTSGASWVPLLLCGSGALWGLPWSPCNLESLLAGPQGSRSLSPSYHQLEGPRLELQRPAHPSAPLELVQGVLPVLHLYTIAFIIRTCTYKKKSKTS